MKTRLLAGLLGAGLLLTPLSFGQDNKTSPSSKTAASADKKQKSNGMDEDMRQAIAFEKHKDEAAARQARIEAKYPTVTYSADRVKDPGPKK